MKKIIPIFILFLFSCKKDIETISATQQKVTTSTQLIDTIGYKVNQSELLLSKQNDFGKSYWKNVGVPGDIMVSIFQSKVGFLNQISYGDFNNDGYIDIYNAGSSYKGPYSNSTFLVWNISTKKYDSKNLYNNPSDSIFGGNKNHVVPAYLNDDNYVDYVIFDNGDEGFDNSPNEPVRLVLSDGKGKYDLKEITTNESEPNVHHKDGGDVGDLNNDGIPDLVITCSNEYYVYWGIKSFPYFSQTNREKHPMSSTISRTTNAFIGDINKDKNNDIIFAGAEDIPNTYHFLITNNQSIRLPFNPSSYVANEDYIIDDFNGDGLTDLISINHDLYGNRWWGFSTYLQQTDGSFKLDSNTFQYMNKSRNDGTKFSMFYCDINNDGKKDIGYYDGADNGQLKDKTIFIREGNQFVEKDYYQFDLYAKVKMGK